MFSFIITFIGNPYTHTHTKSSTYTIPTHTHTHTHTHPLSLRKEYEAIADRALTTPTSTQHMMELKEYMEKAEAKDVVELTERMSEARHRYTPDASLFKKLAT